MLRSRRISFFLRKPPFREQTRLRFALPEAAHVQLVVYDVRGREASTLIDR